VCPSAKFKTLVVVGDSISDVGNGSGGAAEQPFYRTLLVKNDDVLYPEWKGFDLATCWGLDPIANVVKVSKGGSVAAVPAGNNPTDMGILLNQVTSLPASLPGPVLVVGTIGGNDVKNALFTDLVGTAAQQQAKIDAFVAGYTQAMNELTRMDRFGPGVKVSVLMPNVYDPSGGTGHFFYAPNNLPCLGLYLLWPDSKATAPYIAPWNTAMAAAAATFPNVHMFELGAPFKPHAVTQPASSNWFYQDCTHPNRQGHNALRTLFWAGIVALP
jgi:lysophospholipase L1-like esterase